MSHALYALLTIGPAVVLRKGQEKRPGTCADWQGAAHDLGKALIYASGLILAAELKACIGPAGE